MIQVDLAGGDVCCPFCDDTGYDKTGLVNHIDHDCDVARIAREEFANTIKRTRAIAIANLKREGLANE